jgi:uncharacterized protein YggU (UPF0235/DUF167 family)
VWRSGPDGREELEVRVTEAPVDGGANAGLVRLLADALDIPKKDVGIVSGHASRHKRVLLPLELDEVKQRLAG